MDQKLLGHSTQAQAYDLPGAQGSSICKKAIYSLLSVVAESQDSSWHAVPNHSSVFQEPHPTALMQTPALSHAIRAATIPHCLPLL